MEISKWSEYYKTCNKVICSGANLKMSEDSGHTVHIFSPEYYPLIYDI